MRTIGMKRKLSIGFVLALVFSLQFSVLAFADDSETELKEESGAAIGTVTADTSESAEVEDITVTGEGDAAEVHMDNVVLDETGDSVSLSGTFTDGQAFKPHQEETDPNTNEVDNGMHLEATGTNVLKEVVVGTDSNANPFILLINVKDTASTLLVNSLKVKDTWEIGTWESTRMTWVQSMEALHSLSLIWMSRQK